uniref:Uncharacterized protein n=1 Tax=Anguilla anguilla TaxID=7936 RepID=A0A0E9XN57_ANGAN
MHEQCFYECVSFCELYTTSVIKVLWKLG